MIPSINDIFFYFATLFGVNASFVAEQAIVTIDLVNKTGQIEYVNLETPSEALGLAQAGLDEISDAIEFDNYFSQLKLTSKRIYKKGSKLNATLNFSYFNQNELLVTLYFYPNPNGSIEYVILEREKVISSNGKRQEEDELEFLQWSGEESRIELILKCKTSKENEFKDLVSLRDFWEGK
ncbi:MAG: hypothetical protein GY816_19345 [Cytophagales bacterium]|nr:hypothetical protein [Cytophagales bacterium]